MCVRSCVGCWTIRGTYAGGTGTDNGWESGIRCNTIGEALEATAQTAADKPVDQSDAAAIQAAEVRATGSTVITPGGLAASAQSAAAHNETVDRDENKIKLNQVLAVN